MENAVQTMISGGGQGNLSSITGIGAGIEPYSAAEQRTIKSGFTLAEVLITLGIIGVVAAMTLPSLTTKIQDTELVTRTKKTVSNIQNAALLAQKDLGVIGDNTALFDTTKSSIEVAQNFVKYFNGAKLCTSKTQKGCEKYYYQLKYAMPYTDGNGTNAGVNINAPKIILSDGAILQVHQKSACDFYEDSYEKEPNGDYKLDEDGNKIPVVLHRQYCAVIRLDTNGLKNPNQFGADAYGLYVKPDAIVPETWNAIGQESLKSILTGSGKLTYKNYSVGQKYDF